VTSTRHRSFTTKKDKAPVTFDVDGEQFTAVPDIPGGVLLDIATALGASDAPDVGVISEFFDTVIVEEDHERFAQLIRKPGGPGVDVLVEIVKFLVEEITGFPTMVQPGSRPQPPQTGPGSRGRRR